MLPDGTWQVGELPMQHEASLVWLKRHLVFEDEGGAALVDGTQRLPVQIDGPAFEAVELKVDPRRGEASLRLDDGSEERVEQDALGMDELTGRFECRVRSGRARAVLSRSAHNGLLEHVEQEQGRFFLRAGLQRLSIRV